MAASCAECTRASGDCRSLRPFCVNERRPECQAPNTRRTVPPKQQRKMCFFMAGSFLTKTRALHRRAFPCGCSPAADMSRSESQVWARRTSGYSQTSSHSVRGPVLLPPSQLQCGARIVDGAVGVLCFELIGVHGVAELMRKRTAVLVDRERIQHLRAL